MEGDSREETNNVKRRIIMPEESKHPTAESEAIALHRTCSAEITVRKSDLEKVCAAVIEGAVYYDYNDNGPSFYKCNFCDGRMWESAPHGSEVRHEADCAYLVAQDIRPHAAKSVPPNGQSAGTAD